eukprot:TRINITY_DN30589_c0_g1_i1.p1 TRINITY_DN30589_c0_g1~~TRINITY_DN30589_c0_g1_i1.p1  ORF type:complete len:282 (+),score=41.24 TRINITY_DN30589_c0_g1_i1:188-1033(+)
MSVVVHNAEKKGLGAFAAKYISAGELVLQESPLLIAPVSDGWDLMKRKAEECDEETLSKIQKLEGSTLKEKINANCFETCNDSIWVERASTKYFVLYDRASRMNHSCIPNCTYQFTDDYAILITSIQPIQLGQELTLSYCPTAYENKQSRLAYLQQHFGFQCLCEHCAAPEDNSPTIYSDISELQSTASAFWNAEQYQEASESLSSLIALFNEYFPSCVLLRLSFTAKMCVLQRYGIRDDASSRIDDLRQLYGLQYGNSHKGFAVWCKEQGIPVSEHAEPG